MSNVWKVIAFAWLVCLAGGLFGLNLYAFHPAEQRPGHDLDGRLQSRFLARDKPSLFLFLHPQCPCSNSSAGEFERLLARFPDAFTTTVFVYAPAGAGDEWNQTSLVQRVMASPTVSVQADIAGELARSLGATTSGEVFLYTTEGRLRFQGGITGSRGHEGDNAGRQTLEQVLRDPTLPLVRMPVFGCSLTDN